MCRGGIRYGHICPRSVSCDHCPYRCLFGVYHSMVVFWFVLCACRNDAVYRQGGAGGLAFVGNLVYSFTVVTVSGKHLVSCFEACYLLLLVAFPSKFASPSPLTVPFFVCFPLPLTRFHFPLQHTLFFLCPISSPIIPSRLSISSVPLFLSITLHITRQSLVGNHFLDCDDAFGGLGFDFGVVPVPGRVFAFMAGDSRGFRDVGRL